MVLIRAPANWHDIMAMEELAKKMHEEGAFRDLDYSSRKVLAIGKQVLNDPNYFGVLCEYNDEIIGLMVCYVSEFYFGKDKIAQDMVLYVDKSRRGGLGAIRMIERYVEWAVEKGCKEIQLGQTVGIDAEAVHKLYTHAGFELIGQLYKRRVE